MYFVFAYAVHNYRVSIAWDEREIEFRALETELERIKSELNNKEWAKKTEEDIYNTRYNAKRNTKSTGDLLINKIQEIIKWKPPTAEDRVIEKSKMAKAAAFIANVTPVTTTSGSTSENAPTNSDSKDEDVGLKVI